MSAFLDSKVLRHLAYNVFLPPKLPQEEIQASLQQSVDLAIVDSVIEAGQQYQFDPPNGSLWAHIKLMLGHLSRYVETPIEKPGLGEDMSNMKPGDILTLYIKAQNACVIIRKQQLHTTYEVFEVQAQTEDVMSVPGKIVRHFPGPIVQLPNSVANDRDFITEVANILVQMDTEIFEKAHPTTRKAGMDVLESRDSVNPNYFIQYFFGFLRGMGTNVDTSRVVKRLADEVLWMNARNPWRRSPIWLIVRVVLQTSFDSTTTYKHFMAYYHAYILSQCSNHNTFSSDLLYAMRIKMAKRMHKVKDSVPEFTIRVSKSAAKRVQGLLQGRWDAIQLIQSQSPSRNHLGADFESAVHLTLPNSLHYLERVFRGRHGHTNPSKFSPKHVSRLAGIKDFSDYANGALSRAFNTDPHLALYDFEASVFDNLAGWTSDQLRLPGACATMSSCFQQYITAAKPHYTADVADQSIMILTLMRIWMAIDELAVGDCPLLSHYSPELPPNILDPLLLRTTQHIDQARIIQKYIHRRHISASKGNPSIFSDEATQHCFSVQYFRNSTRHQQLKATIEAHAQEQKNRKIQELEGLNAKYEELGVEIQEKSHEYRFTPNGRRKHDRQCECCSLEKKRKGLKIQPHEWPLPPRQLDAEMVVFELDRPGSFVVWRDTTYEILNLGATSPRGRCNSHTTLEGYTTLKPWLPPSSSVQPRVTIASMSKAFKQTHYGSPVSIPASEYQVCLDNALQFKIYDKNGDTWAAGPFSGVTLAQYGTFKLPTNSLYRHIAYAVEGTTHTSNQILADQHGCPNELSLHEHIAFGTLRSGARLQWMNIVRGLEEDLLTFSADEVGLLHTQAAWQLGPLTDRGSREWHEELGNSEFGRLLVFQCKRVLDRVKANWLQATSVSTIVMLVTRFLASTPTDNNAQLAYDFLRSARGVTHKWLEQLKSKLKSATGEADVVDYQRRVCEMAAICRATYDVGPRHLVHLLAAPDDFVPFIAAFICLCDNKPPDIGAVPITLSRLLCRDRRFAHQVVPFILTSLHRHDILSAPLSEIWPDYRGGSNGWQVCSAPNNRWVTTTTAKILEHRTQQVHLNLVTGQLLIAGKPLGRLPRHYVEHPTYIRLFGQKILDVIPAKFPGMQFTTRDHIHGYQVSFAFETDSKQLIIQARKDGHLYELLPYETLLPDLPQFLSEDYHHWADIKGNNVEFRPLSSPWSVASREWHLSFTLSRTLKRFTDGASLVDIHSVEFESLARMLCPLESSRYLHATRSVKGRVGIQLPRMKFSFFINDDYQLESRNFRGQILDEDQSSGTLFGLKNQLILRSRGTFAQSLPRSRSVLIPDGEIDFTASDDHASVSIRFDSRRSVDVHRYKIDEDLGYLATDAGLTSRLFKIYLHALTSYCLPDPLTGRTGTEEALHELSQGSSSSFEQLDLKQIQLLKGIGLLTPKREYYPKHLKCMQTTHWNKLPSLSQHFGFSFAVARILRRADTLQLFHPLEFNLNDYITALENSDTLLNRASRRTVMYYPPDTANNFSQILGSDKISDSVKPGRDSFTGDWAKEGQLAKWASGLSYQNWGKPVFVSCKLVSLVQSWVTLDDLQVHIPLTYQSSWFSLGLSSSWITLYNLMRQAKDTCNRYMLSACLSSIAFGQAVSTDLIFVFLAFATNPSFRRLTPPPQRTFRFGDGYEPARDRMEKFVSSTAYPIDLSPARDLNQEADESYSEFWNRKQTYYRTHSSTHQSQLVQNLMAQWQHVCDRSSAKLCPPSSAHSKWINVQSCLKSAQEYFTSCIQNIDMREHLQKLEAVLSSRPTSTGTKFIQSAEETIQPPVITSLPADPWSELSIPSIMHSRRAPNIARTSVLSKLSVPLTKGPASDTVQLESLFSQFQEHESPLNRRYGADLDESRRELGFKPTLSLPRRLPRSKTLDRTRERCLAYLMESSQLLQSALYPQTGVERIVSISGVWPRITARTLLQQLTLPNRHRCNSLPAWWDSLIGYAQVFSDYQRSHRLMALAESNSVEEFYKELEAPSKTDPGENDPDWLLVQIDGNFGARAIQRQVAQEMISPSSGSSTVLQLNMGEGKSSVIVPIIAAALADSSRLVRVVVLKPLWHQMFELLVNRLAGLSNRRVYYLPFARQIKIDNTSAEKLQDLYKECMREGGILLAQPEHILSFKLMSIDRLISPSSPTDTMVANTLRDMQSWLNYYSRDILDESDEILHVRYRLVYTIGEQKPLDDHPDRWTTTQQLLRLAATHVKRLHQDYPDSIFYITKSCGQFPTLRITPDCPAEVEVDLISAIAADVRRGRLLNLNCDSLHPSVRGILSDFFTKDNLSYSQYVALRNSCDPMIWKGLLLIRGLLASGILVFALKHKHHRVDYGLDLSRTLLAVPYRAKDLPSLRAEFGHPDVAVVLTCLSYYYQGLTDHQLDQCFELLYKLDNPTLEYKQWVQLNDTTPDDLRQLNNVNIKDRKQFTERLVPTFSRNSATIDFFLSSIVFPREAKEFPEKLAASGWDLAESKTNVVTGFSGTNDNRYLLPTSIVQADPVKQLSTNALVLTYLLHPENNLYMCMRGRDGSSLTTEEFLKQLTQKSRIRVLLDVGAQMLELQNEDLVRCWLRLRPDAEAAVYFNDRDELMVLPRDGIPALLNTSPFSQRLDTCIVYLDDGHTRGTDLKLPRETHALVTLGPKVTKDRLLQGCMRMRKLGHGQTVVFAAPPEIDNQIRNASPNPIKPHARINALDILRWAMLQTCKDLQHHVPHWAQQGIEHARRHEAERQYKKSNNILTLQKGWTAPESRPLEEMYGVLPPETLGSRANSTQRAFDIPSLRRGLENLGVKTLDDPSMDEEQEREVNHEVEREQQVQRPSKGQAAIHSIHSDIESFIGTGVLPTSQSGILPLFHAFRRSNPHASKSWSRLLFASADFLQTTAGSPADCLSEYMRPVNWVVSGPGDIRVVLSPHEVNELLPLIRKSSVVRLHVYAPRVSLSMLSFSDLQFYSISAPPTSLTHVEALSTAQLQLDLFAGQLYLSSYQDYLSLCVALGIYVTSGGDDLGVEVGSDGFVKPQHRNKLIRRHPAY
ncbi:unnamed protein product, partial [Rhizoctonia solani]